MTEIFNDILEIEKRQIPSVLCIVTATSGSTPRKAGSKMLVLKDGSVRGTIGGGSIEFQVISEAMSLLEEGGGIYVRSFRLLEDLNMQCGGSMDVYFEPLSSHPRLYIFGGGHIGKALAGYASGLGFHPVVIDPRPDIFGNWNLPEAEFIREDHLKAASSLDFNDNTYAVIVTHQHKYDEDLLIMCAPKRYAYLGMIGSKRKIAEISRRAIDEGKLTADELSRVDMPVGIPFAAETPAEIAISIVAKMIDVKNTREKS